MKATIRTLNRFRLYTVVNILGLALSLACVILIVRHVHQETTVNHFATDLKRTYLMTVEDQNGQRSYRGARDWDQDGDYLDPLRHEAVECISVFIPYEEDHILSEGHRYNIKLVVTDSNFLKILPYPLIQGPFLFVTIIRLQFSLYGYNSFPFFLFIAVLHQHLIHP